MTTRLHIVHVANMKNKGTQALLKCDVIAIREIIQDTYLSVSTTDLEGVRHLNLPLDSILPPIVDIPYERSDQLARVRGWSRSSVQYKASVLAFSVFMVIQLLLSAISVMFMKIGMLAIYRRKVMEHFKDCHLVVSHSNENFKETASLLPLTPTWAITRWSMLLVRTWTVFVAKSFRKPIIMFPNSVGPFRTRVAQRLAAFALNNCNSLLIRDEVSYEITKNLVKPNFKERVILTYDTALLFQPRTQVKHKHTAGPLVAVCPGIYGHRLPPVKIQEYVSAHAEALDEAVATYGFHLLFLPHYVSGFEHDDLHMCRSIISKMKQKDHVECISAN
ncbi:polysaccharide pyruvyl transferase family protein, partial [Candidatus Bathyarchaeota archaeon]|nr:polysaccharide pyruvyl transferase family protein [Candidatus Bathyarchaeota archaeon]